jgi:hypothetical protein
MPGQKAVTGEIDSSFAALDHRFKVYFRGAHGDCVYPAILWIECARA